jgi:hypothetical protein
MRKKTFSEEQIALALRQAETGMPVTEVCRKMGGTVLPENGNRVLYDTLSIAWRFT